MTRSELRREIRKPGRVFVAAVAEGDIITVQAVKSDLLWRLEGHDNAPAPWGAHRDEDGDLHLDSPDYLG